MTASNLKRRTFLKSTLAAGAFAAAAGAGLLKPTEVLAIGWPKKAFNARNKTDVLKALFGSTDATPNKAIKIRAPIQTDGKAVPVNVSVGLGGVDRIAIVTRENLHPLNVSVRLFKGANSYGIQIKMDKTSTVTAYVKAAGKLYSATTKVKVNTGGYGMHH